FYFRIVPHQLSQTIDGNVTPFSKTFSPVSGPLLVYVPRAASTRNRSRKQDHWSVSNEIVNKNVSGSFRKMFSDLEGDHEIEQSSKLDFLCKIASDKLG